MNWQKRKLDITTFGSTKELDPPTRHAQSWENLTDYLAKRPPTAAHKEELRLLKLARFGDKPNPNGQHSYRWNGNVLHVSGVTGDYDAGTVTIDEAEALLKARGIAAFLYTSPSHLQPGKGHRWRVLAPLSNDLPPDQYAGLVNRLNGALGGILAGESWVLTQPMYYGKVEAEGVVYETRTVEGKPLDAVTGIEPLDKKGQPIIERPAPVAENRAPISAPNAEILTRLERVLAQKDPDCDEPEWWKLGAIVSLETGHSDEGYALFDAWSSKGSKYQGSEDTARKWEQIGQRGDVANPATIGSLLQETIAADDDFGDPLTEQQLDETYDVIAEAEAATKVKLSFVPLDSFVQREPVQYLVDGMIEQGQLIGFIGRRKGGKSYGALDLAFAVAQGRPFAKHAVLVPGPVVWIAAEGARSLRQRRGAQWLAHYGPADIRVWPYALNMRKQETYEGLLEACQGVRLVIIDSLRRVTPGGKENSSDEISEVLAYAEQLALETNATVCMIAHAGKGGAKGEEMTARGTSAIEDALEAGFMFDKLENGIFRMTPGFARDEESGDDVAIHFGLKEIKPEGLAPGAIVDWDKEKPLPKVEPKPLRVSSTDTLALSILRGLTPVDGEPVIQLHAYEGAFSEALGHPDNGVTRAKGKLDTLIMKGVVELDHARGTITMLQAPPREWDDVEDLLAALPPHDLDEVTI